LTQVLTPLAEVLIMLHDHVGVLVSEQFGHFGYADAILQRVGRVGVAEGVGDDAGKVRQLVTESATATAVGPQDCEYA
jgi:hypothetical protein